MPPRAKSKKAPSAKPASARKEICFVIMPFGGWFDHYYSQIYVPAIDAVSMAAKRADSLYRSSAIVHDIWDLTKKSKLVLAELTGRNPNVFYELGLAHALAKPVILLTQTMDDVPFDLRSLRVLVYDVNLPDWGTALKTNIMNSIRETIDSPLQSVLPTFLQVDDSYKPSVTTTEKELIALRQDVDALKRESFREPRLFRKSWAIEAYSRGLDEAERETNAPKIVTETSLPTQSDPPKTPEPGPA